MDRDSLYHSRLQTGDYHPHVVYYYFKQWDGFFMPFHVHNHIEIMYVISGRCMVETKTETFWLKKGDFIFLDANVDHRLEVEKDEPCRMLNVEFEFAERQGVLPSIRQLSMESPLLSRFFELQRPYIVLKDPNEVYQALKSLVLELDKPRMENRLMVDLLLMQLLLRIAGLALATSESGQPSGNVYVEQASAFIRTHYDCNIQIKDIAAAVNLHPAYLQRIFKNATGSTVMEFLTSIRLEKAKMLLLETDIPAIEIPDYVGINSRQYFSALFKKHTGKSPSHFRKAFEKS